MTSAELTLQSRLAEILDHGNPFEKEASADPQLDMATEAVLPEDAMVEAAEAARMPEILQPIEPVQKEASVTDFSMREIWSSEQFKQGFKDTLEKRAYELEDALEKVAKRSFLGDATRALRGTKKGLGGSTALGAAAGAAVNAHRTHQYNKRLAPDQQHMRKSVLGGAAKGAAGGAAAGAALHTGAKAVNNHLEFADKRAKRMAAVSKRKKADALAFKAGKTTRKAVDGAKGLGRAIAGAAGKAKEVTGKAAKGVVAVGDKMMDSINTNK